MGIQVKLALRNVFRNRRRTAITLAAMAFGASSIILFGGFVNFIFISVRESTIKSQVGHIQLYRKGFFEKGSAAPNDYMIANFEEIRALAKGIEHVKDVIPRLGFSGLVSTGETTTSFVGSGGNPEGEEGLSSFTRIVEGKALSSSDPRGVTLGLGMARGLGVKEGDSLTLLATTKNGGINALAVKVRGIWESGEKAYDDRLLKAPIQEVQRLLDNEGEVQSIVLLLDNTENTGIVRDHLAALIRDRGFDLEIKTWEDLALRYHQVRDLFSKIFNVMALIVSFIVVLGIANTMTMSIFERTREIGTIMALGTRRSGVISMFLLEGIVLGVLGGILGTVAGVVIAKAVSYVGIPMPPPPGSTRGFIAQILIVPAVLAKAFRLSLIAAILSSLYPAWRASRLNITEALRHV
ncbi:MAG: FtsX-like permease family protein [Candidatus Deferrimicrobiota bacterium]